MLLQSAQHQMTVWPEIIQQRNTVPTPGCGEQTQQATEKGLEKEILMTLTPTEVNSLTAGMRTSQKVTEQTLLSYRYVLPWTCPPKISTLKA